MDTAPIILGYGTFHQLMIVTRSFSNLNFKKVTKSASIDIFFFNLKVSR